MLHSRCLLHSPVPLTFLKGRVVGHPHAETKHESERHTIIPRLELIEHGIPGANGNFSSSFESFLRIRRLLCFGVSSLEHGIDVLESCGPLRNDVHAILIASFTHHSVRREDIEDFSSLRVRLTSAGYRSGFFLNLDLV